MGNEIKQANRIVDAAVGVNETIRPSKAFEFMSVINDGAGVLRVAIDQDSTVDTNNIIFINSGEGFEMDVKGSILNYSAASDTCTFRYVLR